MAIYHLHVKVIGRKSGSSAVASAAETERRLHHAAKLVAEGEKEDLACRK
jgi:diadenosine tetraphosphate (Ap4A) HIT family hydrolase